MKNYKEKSVQTPMLNVLCIPNYLKQSPRGLPTNKPSYKKKEKTFHQCMNKDKDRTKAVFCDETPETVCAAIKHL